TDRSVCVIAETGGPVFAAPLAYDPETSSEVCVGRLEDPQRFVVWYRPGLQVGLAARKVMPHYLVESDVTGRELARRTLPPEPRREPSYAQALLGLTTSPAEGAILVGSSQHLLSGAGSNRDRRVRPLPVLLSGAGSYFLPGAGWDASPAAGPRLA